MGEIQLPASLLETLAGLRVTLHPDKLALVSLPPDQMETAKALFERADSEIAALVARPDEITLVLPAAAWMEARFGLKGYTSADPFRALILDGDLDLDTVGVMAAVTRVLADAGIPVFALSTYRSDILLVKAHHAPDAHSTLERFLESCRQQASGRISA